MMEQECKKGAQNILQIIGFDKSDFKYEEFITDVIIKEIVDELYEDRRPTGNLSLWVYLLRYERHDFYPQNILGCFMDMVNIVCNCHAKREVSENDIKNTAIFNLLNSFRHPEPKFDNIYNAICSDESVKGFSSLVDQYESRINFIKIATLFMYLRNRYTEDFKYEPKLIESLKKYGEEFEFASYLLGVVLGHMHTYDCLYEKLPLAIFKKKVVVPEKPEEKPQHNQGKKHLEATEQPKDESSQATEEITKGPISPQESGSGIQEGIIVESRMNSRDNTPIEDDSATNNEAGISSHEIGKKPSRSIPSFPFWMAKMKSDGITPCKSPKPVKITSYDMFFKYDEKGWKILREEKIIQKSFFD